jgi:hypothetical protein
MNQPSPSAESQLVHILFSLKLKLSAKSSLTLGELIVELHESGHWLLCLFFSIPFLIPVPLPGLSTPFGLVIGIAAIQILFNLDPWLPKKLQKLNLPQSTVERVLTKASWLVIKFEKHLRPRLSVIVQFLESKKISALTVFTMAVLLALPMPPGFNAPPALTIILFSIGHLESDGAVLVAALCGAILNVALFAAVFILGFEGLEKLFGL